MDLKIIKLQILKVVFSGLFILLGTSSVFGQDETIGIPFVAYWSIGDSFDFKVTKVDKTWKGTDLTKNDSSSYIANFEVIDSTENSYTIKWTYKNQLFSSDDETFNHLFTDKKALNDILSKYDLTSIIYKVDEFGETPEILNIEEIKKLTKEMFNAIVDQLPASSTTESKEFKKIMNTMVKMYTTDEAIEQLVLVELQYIHFPFGTEYDPEEPFEYESEMVSLISNDNIRADVILSVDDYDIDNSYCVIKEEVIINAEDVKDQVSILLKKMDLDSKVLKELLNSAVYNIEDVNYYHYYYDPGIPDKISISRKIDLSIGEIKTLILNTVKIELIEVN